MPDNPAELRATIHAEHAGDANAYVAANESDFRRMGCKGRGDLLQVLLNEGLALEDVPFQTHSKAALCAFMKKDMSAVSVLMTPDFITAYELSRAGEASAATLLWSALYSDDYDMVRYLLEHGVHTFNYHRYWEPLTREEHLLLAAESAVKHSKEDAMRAFGDSGFGHILAAARNEDKVTYVTYRLKGGKAEGGGGGLLRSLVGGLAGAALGGTTGAAIGLLEGSGSDSAGGKTVLPDSGPLPLDSGRADPGLVLKTVSAPQRGMLVAEVLAGGAGEAAGLRVNDLVIRIAGEPVALRGSFYVATAKAAMTPEYEVEFLREGELSSVTFGQHGPSAPEESALPIAEPASQSVNDDTLGRLEKLGDLRDRGVISAEEFEAMKVKIIGGT